MRKLKHLLAKLINRSKMVLGEFLRIQKCYSIKYAFFCIGWWIGFYCRNKKIADLFTRKKQYWIDSYIEKNYANIIKKYENKPESSQIQTNLNIWCFWGQGEESMPDIVRACYKQMERMNPGKVVLLNIQNVKQYVDIPEFVFQKLKRGDLLYAHFSDILRNSLLSKYGGLWLDVTCWTAHPMPTIVHENIFFSPHNEQEKTYWCTYAMGSNRIESITFSFVRDMLIAVCKNEEVWPDYLFQDRLLSFAHRKLEASKYAINSVPNNATKRFLLYPMMNKPFDKEYYTSLIKTDWLFKLSYKSFYTKCTEGKPTFYAAIIDGAINKTH